MSGIEVAGLVLGAIPLVISALEHYADGASRVKSWWRYKSELRSLRRILDTEFEIYRNVCELLLSNIARPEQIAKLLEEPGGEGWKEPKLEEDMRRLLHTSYSGYIGTINEINSAVAEFKERLRLGPEGEAVWKGEGSFTQAYKVFKFSIRKSAYDDLIKRIKDSNNTLQLLTDTSLKLESARSRRRRKAPNYRVFRNCAAGVYTIISKSLRCSCSSSHNFALRLDPRTEDLMSSACGDEDMWTSQLRFRVLLSYAQDPKILRSAPWAIEEAEIQEIAPAPVLTPALDDGSVTKKTAVKKTVNFMQANDSGVAVVAPKFDALKEQKIDDLCVEMAKLQKMTSTVCLGVLVDEMTKRQHALYPIPALCTEKMAWSTTTLDCILSDVNQTPRPLRNSDKRRLALTLASNVLQLYKTPWLKDDLRKSEIAFLQQPGAPPYEHPFLYKSVSAHKQLDFAAPVLAAVPMVRNQTLFNLGILLIELCLGKTIDRNELHGLGQLISDVYDECGGRYGSAVRRCIWCDFDCQNTDLSDERFCAAVYDGVVSLLAEDLREFMYGLS